MNEKNKALAIQEEWGRATTAFQEAKVLRDQKLWEGATSRVYYAAFHATLATLLTQGLQPKSHQGVLYYFVHNFAKKGLIEPEYSQILARVSKYREEADYRHTMVFTKEQVDQTLNEVDSFLKRIATYLKATGY